MTGPHDSVIGVKAELATQRMRTGMPVRFEVADGGVRIEGVLVDCDPATGRATAIEPVRVPWPDRTSSVASSATSTRSRARTSQDAVGSNCFTSSQ